MLACVCYSILLFYTFSACFIHLPCFKDLSMMTHVGLINKFKMNCYTNSGIIFIHFVLTRQLLSVSHYYK